METILDDKKLLAEAELIDLARKDPQQFRPLYEQNYHTIFRFIHHRTEDKEVTADLTAQVFLKALTQLSKYKFQGLPFSAWLYRIAINECNDYFRRVTRARVVYLDDSTFDHLYEEVFESSYKEAFEQKLETVLQQLKPDEVQLIELRFFEGMSFKLIGDILEITENNAKVRTYRILDKMKKIFLSGL